MFENITDTEWAYIAGIIDGEGTLGVYLRSKSLKGTRQITPTTSFRPRLQVVNTKLDLMIWLRDRLYGDINAHQYRNQNSNIKYTWRNGSIEAIQTICAKCLPYLVIKKKQAELVLRFPSNAVCNQWTVEKTKQIKIEKRSLYEETLSLNHRGQLVQ